MNKPNLLKRNLRRDTEGQVTIDYLIGITIFIVALFFIFQYSAGLFTPFQSNSDEVTLVADRVATSITEKEISAGNINTPNLIDGNKTVEYFDQLSTDIGYKDEVGELGLRGDYHRYELNVTLENSTEVRMAGKALPFSNNIGQTKRIVLIEDSDTGETETAILSVRVW
ncbi:hypothetical protein [Methanococcoides sp. AM1]|uniref:DUF7287 family protein n=1 Tax=Methanococcoides sp. AM1 TaxID=1201011 RepID=UPI0010832901|nr:hypothetical protein [Methanococcoides sp. AM1]